MGPNSEGRGSGGSGGSGEGGRRGREEAQERAGKGVTGSGAGGEGDGRLLPWERQVMEEVLGQYRKGWFLMKQDGEGGDGGGEGAPSEEYEDGEEGVENEEGVVQWVRPARRATLALDAGFHVPKSLRRRIKSGRFVVTSDLAFGAVIRECGAERDERPETWLHEDIVFVFELLHRAGHAHSVEVWREIEGRMILVGGLYGLALGGLFCGESMFSRPELGGTDASKVALVYLVERLRELKFEMLDTQLWNPHMAQFGCTEIPDEAYTRAIEGLVKQEKRAWLRGEMG